MGLDRLITVLETLGEQGIRIDRVLFCKIGCTSLKSKKGAHPEGGAQKLTAPQEPRKAPNPYAHIIEALEKHGNVFDIKKLGIGEEGFSVRFGSDNSMFVEGEVFSLRVDLPDRVQKYRDEFGKIGSPIEEFNVISNGSLFAAFARVDEYPIFTFMAHEYREIVAAQIDKDTPFNHIPFGPCPIHPDFYIVVRQNDGNRLRVETRVYSKDEDVFVVTDAGPETDADRVIDLLWEIHSEVLDFYVIMMDESDLADKDEELTEEFSNLSKSLKEILQTPWWRLIRAGKLAANARANISNIHFALVEHERLLLNISRDTARFLRAVKDNGILSSLHRYFHEQTESEADIPDSLSSALEHFDTELQTAKNTRGLVIASVLGAALGALLTFLLTTKW